MNHSKFAMHNSVLNSQRPLLVGTRGSALARRQAEFVIAALKRLAPTVQIEMRIIQTTGDRDQTRPLAELGELGVFTKELEHALRSREIDLAVHSLKDLPTAMSDDLVIAAILQREDARDCLVSRHGLGLMELPRGARVGTSSARRAVQVLAQRPDVTIVPLRGNVDTRLHKAQSDTYDAIVLAAAGLIRLGRADEITEYLPFETMLPDPGQGALAVQIRADEEELEAWLAALDHPPTRAAVTAERAFLRALGGGCRMPVGAYAEWDANSLYVRGIVETPRQGIPTPDSVPLRRGEIRGPATQAEVLGMELARQLLREDAAELWTGRYWPTNAPCAVQEGRLGEASLRRKRILITRAREQAGELAALIRARGGEPIEFPTIAFAPLDDYRALDDALARLSEFDWVVFTSANGVRAVSRRLAVLGSTLARFEAVRVAAIGPGTARALKAIGVHVAFVPSQFLGEQIARELPIKAGQRALLLRADLASQTLAQGLAGRGVHVTDVDAYRTVMPVPSPIDLDGVDAVTFTSSSTVRNFVAMLDNRARAALDRCEIFCIGPVTADTARELGLRVTAIAQEHTLEGLVETMAHFYSPPTTDQ